MPQSANIDVDSDKSPHDIQSREDNDENANLKVSFISNNGNDSLMTFHDDEEEENTLSMEEDFFENFHPGYKRESEHR